MSRPIVRALRSNTKLVATLGIVALSLRVHAQDTTLAAPPPTLVSDPADGTQLPPTVDEPAAYKPTVDAAISAYRARDLQTARRLFTEAHMLSPSARTLRGLGVVTLELGKYAEAVHYLNAALRSRVKPLDPALRQRTEQLLADAEVHVARVLIAVTPKDARLRIDDGAPEVSRGELVLAVGAHTLEFERHGFQKQRRSIDLAQGAQQRLEVVLSELRTLPLESPAPRPSWRRSPWLWTAVGMILVGGTALGLGLGLSSRERAINGGSTDSVVGRVP